jgi:hypothetical protein
MPFRLPKNCREYFRDITGKVDGKLNYWFDGYYLSFLVGLAQTKIDSNAEFESSELVDEYPIDYRKSSDYIAALLISTEAKRIPVDETNADALERLMTTLLDSHSRTRLTAEGENRLNQYAARGISVILEKMPKHTRLDEFYQDYFECFKDGVFIENQE